MSMNVAQIVTTTPDVGIDARMASYAVIVNHIIGGLATAA